MRSDEIFGLIQVFRGENSGFLLLALEFIFWLVAAVLAWALIRLRPRWIVSAERWVSAVSHHPRAYVLGIFAAVIALRLALLALVPVPLPYMHDEFSYLLGADTFAHGHLTNPSHPMAVHFETFHVNMWPTYQSMYPPFQGLVLAVGEVLMGNPWMGVLFSTATMCAVICWMLQGFVSSKWALLGGIFAFVRYGIFSYWMNSYLGGAVAATGGALLLGAYARLRRNPNPKYSFLMAAGLIVLANSRPFEGMMFAVPIVLFALIDLIRSQIPKRIVVFNLLAPSALLLMVGFAWMGYYNWRGTGNALRMPYQVNHARYHITEPFLGQHRLPIPNYAHQSMRAVYVFWELPDYLNSKSLDGVQKLLTQKAVNYYAFFIWPGLFLFAAGILACFRETNLRVVACSISSLCAGLFLQLWKPMPHYAAPATGAVILVFIAALKGLHTEQHAEWAFWARRSVIIFLGLWMLVPIVSKIINPYGLPEGSNATTVPSEIERDRIETILERSPGRHLVIVNYPWVGNWATMDWIYNRADIDDSKVVWARDMGFIENRELLDYYSDRDVWYVTRLANMPVLIPYDQARPGWKIAAKFIPETTKWKRERSLSELAQQGSQPRTSF